MTEKAKNGAKPTFDFNVSRKWQRRMLKADGAMQRAAALVDKLNNDLGADDAAIEAAWSALEVAEARRDELVQDVIQDVPRSWLTDNAPLEINWQDEGALDWVRVDRMQSLVAAMLEALQRPAGN